MQKDNKFTAFFIDTTTAPGSPLTGLSPTITIRDAESPYTVYINNEAMVEIGGGHYIYVFSAYQNSKDYIYTMNPNSSLAFIQNGQTDKRLDYLDKPLSGIIGSFNINKSSKYDFGIQDRNNIEKIVENIEKIKFIDNLQEISTKLDAIDIAKSDIIDTIKSTEIEITSDIVRKSKEIKDDNITTRNLIREKTKKIDQNVSKLSDRQDKTDQMIESESEEIEKEIERILQEEADMIEKQIDEQLNKEADDIEESITPKNNGNT